MTDSRDFLPQFPPRGDAQLPPPYEFRNTDMRVHMVRAAGDRLSSLCERYFNAHLRRNGCTERILPLLSLSGEGFVSVALLHYAEMRSVAPGYAGLGYSSQNELIFSLPVMCTGIGGMPTEIGVFVPFLAVDSALSLISGRDVIGYPKVAGSFHMPASFASGSQCRVDVLATEHTGEHASNRLRPLIEFDSTTAASGAAPRPAQAKPELDRRAKRALWPFGPAGLLYGAQRRLAMDPVLQQLIDESAGVAVSNFSFKQFRDAGRPETACYQAIVRSRMRMLQFHDAVLVNDARIVLHAFPSLDLAGSLGLAKRDDGSLDVLGGYSLSADMRLDTVENLLAVCEPGKPGRSESCAMMPWADLISVPLSCYAEAARTWLRILDGLAHPQGSRRRGARRRA